MIREGGTSERNRDRRKRARWGESGPLAGRVKGRVEGPYPGWESVLVSLHGHAAQLGHKLTPGEVAALQARGQGGITRILIPQSSR